jgi:hypothetical protein
MSSTNLAWDDVIDVHLTFICATDLTHSSITSKDPVTLTTVTPSV